ncbi:hypothetical protein [Tumebacillus permanentifrigoris]|uniref:Secreted protein n=1 Tax=Tumebacillus permanentifrigoris TaxID=378543 RepID=A0A316D7X5_9BACL|nr:hypothetical protein [Tumebacillus permanentifrigoris]PWK11237.1 hypothetical protein C7459_11130 [Tumebacillus permanentifrigoris]
MTKTRWIATTTTTLMLTAALIGCSTNQQVAQDNHSAGSHAIDHTDSQDHAAKPTELKPVWQFSDEHPQARQDTQVKFQLLDPTGSPLTQYDIVHEKRLHLIVVSADLNYFNHLHPDMQQAGLFTQTLNLPRGGRYKLIADVTPTGQSASSYGQWIEVGGDELALKPIQLDTDLTKTVAGQQVTLQFDRAPQAGQETMMTFHFADATTQQPTTDLQPYLGAIGHVVALSADAEQYLHVHPMEEKGSGPDAMFHIEFPKSGLYKIWGQFQRKGEVFIAPFVIRVP